MYVCIYTQVMCIYFNGHPPGQEGCTRSVWTCEQRHWGGRVAVALSELPCGEQGMGLPSSSWAGLFWLLLFRGLFLSFQSWASSWVFVSLFPRFCISACWRKNCPGFNWIAHSPLMWVPFPSRIYGYPTLDYTLSNLILFFFPYILFKKSCIEA